jgi:hypothetical protein
MDSAGKPLRIISPRYNTETNATPRRFSLRGVIVYGCAIASLAPDTDPEAAKQSPISPRYPGGNAKGENRYVSFLRLVRLRRKAGIQSAFASPSADGRSNLLQRVIPRECQDRKDPDLLTYASGLPENGGYWSVIKHQYDWTRHCQRKYPNTKL